MKVTLPEKRVRPYDRFAIFSRVLVVSTLTLVAVGCVTNKPQSRHQSRPTTRVEPPQPIVPSVEPKPVHKTEAKMAVVPQLQFMPVKGVTQKQIQNNFGDYRNGGRTHKGIDIFAPSGRDLIAVTSGYIERTSSKLGGNSIYLRGDNGLTYYYAHLSRYHPKARSGERVDGGMVIGYVGNTGNARSTPAHLHFEIRKNGVPFNPYYTLRDPDMVVTPMGSSTPVEYAEYRTGDPAPAKHSGGAARSSTTASGVKKSSKSSISKSSIGKSKIAAARSSKPAKLAAKGKQKRKQQLAAKKGHGKKKQIANRSKATKKKYASKRNGRGHGSRG